MKKSSAHKGKQIELPTPGSFSEYRRWTRDDFRILHQYYPTKGAVWVARKLGRTSDAVKTKAGRIGLISRPERRWTKKETAYLMQNYHRKKWKEIGEALGRSSHAVSLRAYKIGLLSGDKGHLGDISYWTPKEERLLRELYPTMPLKEIAERLGRSHPSVAQKSRQMGLKSDVGSYYKPREHWTDEDDKLLRKLYSTVPKSEIARRLGRSVAAVSHRIVRRGLAMPSQAWTDEDDALLRKLYGTIPKSEIAHRLGRTVAAVSHRIVRRGLAKQLSQSASSVKSSSRSKGRRPKGKVGRKK